MIEKLHSGDYTFVNLNFIDFDFSNFNEMGIRFALSNVLENKGMRNDELIEWSKKYKTHHLDMNYGGANYQRKNGKSDEVLIVNY